MSRSKKKPIVKEGGFGSEYWRTIRRVQKNEIRSNILLLDLDELNISQPRDIVNDYDYCDYVLRDCDIEYTRK
jgi:hypothetical protein